VLSFSSLSSIPHSTNRTIETDFLESYQTLGDGIVGFGGPDWRHRGGCGEPDGNYGPFCNRKSKTGSPVVPGSAK
jgi:hypothetical protein